MLQLSDVILAECDRKFPNEKGRQAMCTWWPLDYQMVPIIGFELMTYRLQGGCSTN